MRIANPHSIAFLLALASTTLIGASGVAEYAGQDPSRGGADARQERDGEEARRRMVFERPPADLDQVASIIPLGNVNAVPGGHVRPVNHMYVQYLAPQDGGSASLDVDAMAEGRIVMVFHRQTEACVVPDHTVPSGCATGPGATSLIDEYEIFTRHSDSLTSYYDHLHALDARLRLPDWRDDTAGWVRVGPLSILFLGANGVMEPVEVHPGQRVGATRNYFTTWDIGVVDTRRTGDLLGTGLLRYPTFRQFVEAMAASGVPVPRLRPNQPFAGEMFANAACFTDYLTPRLAREWRAKLAGGGSCGRDDWDVAGTLRGNWYRADVVDPTLDNMFAVETNAMSFSPYNLDPANQAKIGAGANFLDMLVPGPTAPPAAIAAARERLDHGLLFTPDRTPGVHLNPDPLAVLTGDYACYDVPDPQSGPPPHPLPNHSVVVYLPVVAGEVHLKLRYFATTCANRLAFYGADVTRLDSETWWGDYVR